LGTPCPPLPKHACTEALDLDSSLEAFFNAYGRLMEVKILP